MSTDTAANRFLNRQLRNREGPPPGRKQQVRDDATDGFRDHSKSGAWPVMDYGDEIAAHRTDDDEGQHDINAPHEAGEVPEFGLKQPLPKRLKVFNDH